MRAIPGRAPDGRVVKWVGMTLEIDESPALSSELTLRPFR
jgi:hypothetical protein